MNPFRSHQLTQLRRTYLVELANEVARVETAIVEAIHAGSLAVGARRDLVRFAHNWKGSGGTYGFPRITELAARFESEMLSGKDIAAIARAFGAVRACVVDLVRESNPR
jgi:HPt (histidine-containing phosphotransfer) domain-containing protein